MHLLLVRRQLDQLQRGHQSEELVYRQQSVLPLAQPSQQQAQELLLRQFLLRLLPKRAFQPRWRLADPLAVPDHLQPLLQRL